MSTSVDKRELLKWFAAEFSLSGDALWITRKLTQSSILERLHFIRDVKGKKYAVYLFVGDKEWDGADDIESEIYESYAETRINGKSVKFKEFIDAIFEDRNADIYVELDYEDNDHCDKLTALIEPIIPIPVLLREIENDINKRNEEIKVLDEQIDLALIDRNWELVKSLNAQKQTLLKEEPLV